MKKPNKEQVITVCNRISLLLHAVACFIGYFIIEAISRHSILKSWNFLVEHPACFLYNTFLIFMTSLLAYLIRKRIFARMFIAVFWLLLGVINGMLLANRVTPFTGPDLKLLKEGLGIFNKYLSPALAVVAIIAVLIMFALIILALIKAPKYQGKMLYLLYIPGIILSIFAFTFMTKSMIKERYLSTYFGNIATAYEDYGYPYCLAVTIFDTGVDKPNGYSEELLDSIRKGSESKKETETEDMPNIIAIQLESFFDPQMVKYLEMSEDPIPFFRSLMKDYSSGMFTVPSVGAGTANTEFETLTGMSMRYFGAGEYPYKSVLNKTPCESVAGVLSQLGYKTHAMHNNEANFYSRRLVYANMGFDDFISAEYMDTQDDVNELGWMRDENLIKYIEQCLDSSETQDFVFAVSVQGHGSYPSEPFRDDYEIQVSGAPSEEANNRWEYYVNEIHEMDQFVEKLVDKLESRGEDTILLLYGDHLPTMGLTEADMKNHNLFTTQYVIWDNMGLTRQQKDIKAYQVMAEVLKKADIHEGTLFQFHQTSQFDLEYQIDLQTLQYDILYGKKYIYGGESPFVKSDMKLGLNDVVLSKVESVGDNCYYIYGENFTQSSRLEINKELVENTVFIDANTLYVENVEINTGNKLDVAQQSNSSTARVLSRSEKIVYQVPGVITMIKNTVKTANIFAPVLDTVLSEEGQTVDIAGTAGEILSE